MWDSKLADDVSPDEVRIFFLSDRGKWFCFYPLGETIERHNGEFGMCPSGGELADQDYSSFFEWPRADDKKERLEGLSRDMGEPLAFVILLNKVHRVFLHGWPIKPLSEGLLCQTSLS